MSLIIRTLECLVKALVSDQLAKYQKCQIFLEMSSGSLVIKLSAFVKSLWSAMMTALTLEKYHTLTTWQGSSDKKRLDKSVLRGKKRPLGVTELQQVTIRREIPFHV